MSRTLSEIYSAAKTYRAKYLKGTGYSNTSSRASIIDSFTWVASACVWTFENVLDVFKVDLAAQLQNRINGTAAYFANALLKYQHGDELIISDDGTSAMYADSTSSDAEAKRIITRVAYHESEIAGFHDKLVTFKVAKGSAGNYSRLDEDELIGARAYLSKLLFAGQNAQIVSRKGDILVPKLIVYYDGTVEKSTVMSGIVTALDEFAASVDFNGVVYYQHIIDAIQSVEHVVDVDTLNSDGIYVYQYNDDDSIGERQSVPRFFIPNSGYLKQSEGTGVESAIPTWSESITLEVEEYKQ